jgi:hypothetical protein
MSLCDWSSDVCSSDLEVASSYATVANCDQTTRCRNAEDATDIDIFVN